MTHERREQKFTHPTFSNYIFWTGLFSILAKALHPVQSSRWLSLDTLYICTYSVSIMSIFTGRIQFPPLFPKIHGIDPFLSYIHHRPQPFTPYNTCWSRLHDMVRLLIRRLGNLMKSCHRHIVLSSLSTLSWWDMHMHVQFLVSDVWQQLTA